MYGKVDMEDALAGTVFALSAAVSTGVADISLLGFDLSGELVNLNGTGISMALALSAAALLTAYATNRMYGDPQQTLDADLNKIFGGTASVETYIAAATVIIVLANGFNILGVSDTIAGSDLLGLAVLAIESAGYYVVAWMG